MALTSGATPLLSVDAVVIDTETTGLDPGKARVLEFAAVRIVGGRLDATGSLRRLIDPGEPIPPAATRVHGIDAAKVAGAPRFAAAWPEIADALGDTILIGHSVGFDLAVLAHECARAGLGWTPPAALDTRLLGEIAEPNLADFSLENLAAWLGVEIADRHSALGDALGAARVFDALIPKLRDRNIRTLAEAIRACRALTRVLDQQHRAGWSEMPSPAEASPGARIDSYPYRLRIVDLMTAARFISPEASVGAALDEMTAARISSLFVAPPGAGAPTRAPASSPSATSCAPSRATVPVPWRGRSPTR